MLYIYELTVNLTLQSVKAMTTQRARWTALVAGRLEQSQESATDVVVDVSLMTAVRNT